MLENRSAPDDRTIKASAAGQPSPGLAEIELALGVAKERLRSIAVEGTPDFDIRGDLYRLALRLAPEARAGEREFVLQALRVCANEVGVDLAAGTGFLTHELAQRTKGTVYAIDVSRSQLAGIDAVHPNIVPICVSPDAPELCDRVAPSSVDFVTSLGGLHHVADHERLFANVAEMLRSGGRFVAVDVCAGSSLSRHFDRVVAAKCITGHSANWLSEESITRLAERHRFEVVRCSEVVPHWLFRDIGQMCLFFKALHAYDLPLDQIERDLQDELGFMSDERGVALRWPLVLFELRRF